jgi:hypothetical protein
MKLQLGFEDHPYEARFSAESPLTATVKSRVAKHQSKAQEDYGAGKTTKEVSEELEKKYKVVETFYEMESELIEKVVTDALVDAFEEIIKGETPDLKKMDVSRIEKKFRKDLMERKFDGVIPNVPTKTSQAGVSHLRKRPTDAKGSRPSFVDTGLYMRSFKAWTEE